MRLLIGGASGFLGQAWTRHLRDQGHTVTRLVRRDAGPGEATWDPYAATPGLVDQALIDEADVVVSLSGANLAHFPWNESYRRTFVQSRLATTGALAAAVARAPRPPVFLAQNGIAGYGDHGDTVITEATATDGDTFLGDVTRQWESVTEPAAAAGARVVVMRTSVVLDRSGGALKAMRIPFLLGLGGRIGSGDQYFPTISLVDWIRAATWLAEQPGASGAYNVTGPAPATNREFTRELARQLRRPAVLPLPAFVPRALVAPIASELLGSARVEPARLLADGFAFEHPTLTDQLTAALATR
ncbi:MAG: TIGR01777 family oxidoreductase [Nocardioidaceae bacterium]